MTDMDLISALFSGKTLETENGEFQIRTNYDVLSDKYTQIMMRHRSMKSWQYVKGGVLTYIICEHTWHIVEVDE